jgi:activating signal cointegrator 1
MFPSYQPLMKVLSIMQPWASLIVMGAKKIEIRSQRTPHRGPLLIHANVTDRYSKQLCSLPAYNKFIRHWTDLPYGSIIGKVNLHTCEPADDIKHLIYQKQQIIFGQYIENPLQELDFGHFAPGKYGWVFSDAQQFRQPIETKGKMRMWDFDWHTNISGELFFLN